MIIIYKYNYNLGLHVILNMWDPLKSETDQEIKLVSF